MTKAPEPSPIGLVIVLAVFAFLLWHGPWDERWGKEAEPSSALQQGTIDCERDIHTLTPLQIELCIDIRSFAAQPK